MSGVHDQVEAVAHAFRDVHAGRAAFLDAVRIAEALLFRSAEPLAADAIADRMPGGIDVEAVLANLERQYRLRGVNLVSAGGRWAFRTAADLAHVLARDDTPAGKPGRAVLEVLAVIAYHQPTTRAEIEAIRGVTTSKGTLDTLLASGWVRLCGRRSSPGRPVQFATTVAFLDHFGLASLGDLPRPEELRGLGLGEGEAGPPVRDDPEPDEADDGEVDLGFAPRPEADG